MTESKRARSSKGVFTRVNLPVSVRYLIPLSRNRGLFAGCCCALLVGGLVMMNFWVGDSNWVSGGPLSAVHAAPDSECQDCHSPFSGADETKCRACHREDLPGTPDFSFQAHYDRVASDPAPTVVRTRELSCSKCHPEHRGRQASPVLDSDDPCLNCHQMRSFESDHPPFSPPDAFAETRLFERALHLSEMDMDSDSDALLSGCSTCHLLRTDRVGFDLVQFSELCEICHSEEEVQIGESIKPLFLQAKFSHRPHLIESGCLDCHQGSVLDASGDAVLPSIEQCRTCHYRERATQRCNLCHRFHPGNDVQMRSAAESRRADES